MKLTWRIWLLVFLLVIALLAIHPKFETGVFIKSVEKNSSIFNQGLRTGEVLKQINEFEINTKEDYSKAIRDIFSDGNEKR